VEEFNAEEINHLNLTFLDDVEVEGNVRILRFKGTLNHDTLPDILKIKEEMQKAYETNTVNLLMDFKRVEDVDSSVLAVLELRLEELQEHHRRMGIVNIPEKLMNFMEIFKEASSFEIFESEDTAIKELGA
jgi:anti-anti-sigma factor